MSHYLRIFCALSSLVFCYGLGHGIYRLALNPGSEGPLARLSRSFGGDILAILLMALMVQLILGILCKRPLGMILAGMEIGPRIKQRRQLIPFYLFDLLGGEFFWLHKLRKKNLLKFRFTKLKVKLVKPMALPALVFFFVGIFMFQSAHFFDNLQLMDGAKLELKRQDRFDLKNVKNYDKFKSFKSEAWGFETFSNLGEGRLALLPSFEVLKEKGKRRVSPYVSIYDFKESVEGRWRFFSLVDHRILLQRFLSRHPMANFLYPHLAKSQFSREKMTQAEHEEFQEILIKAFGLNFSNGLWGLWATPYLRLRESLLRLVRKGAEKRVDLVKLGEGHFLVIMQRFDSFNGKKGQQVTSFIPIDFWRGRVWQTVFDASLEGSIARQLFVKSFFVQSTWKTEKKSELLFPNEVDEISALTLVDFFVNPSLDDVSRDQLEEFLFSSHFDLGKRAIRFQDKVLKEILLTHLERFLKLVRLMNKKKKDYYSIKIITYLHHLRNAIEENDLEYFGLGEK